MKEYRPMSLLCCEQEPFSSPILGFVTGVVWVFCLATCCYAVDDSLTDPLVTKRHLEQPLIELQSQQVRWPRSLQETWMQCLLLDEVELNREAADALALAQSIGMPALPEFSDVLLRILMDEDKPVSCRVSAAQAFIAMGKQPGLDRLSADAQNWPLPLALVMEPVLAKWDHQPMRELWLQRLRTPPASPLLLRTAVEALGTVREPQAEPMLVDLMQSSYSPLQLRLVAARALARLPSDRLVKLATQPLDDNSGSRIDLLLGVQLLLEQESSEAIELLERYADLDDRAVAGEALRQLLHVKPQAVVARAAQNIEDRDANVRAVTVEGLATSQTPESIHLLSSALQDYVPDIRRTARTTLLDFASDDVLLPKVVEETTAVVNEQPWRGIEQSLIILTKLEQRSVRDRLFELLAHDRGEVMETAAWSIKELAQDDWAEQCLQALRLQIDRNVEAQTLPKTYAIMHLLETMGVLQMQESMELLRTFVPEEAPFAPLNRGAAVWAIGEILSGQSDAELERELEVRLNDAGPVLPEYPLVRGMAAVTLGKMQSKLAVESLQKWKNEEGINSFVGGRSAWAVFRITGEPIGEIVAPTASIGGWFVQPLE